MFKELKKKVLKKGKNEFVTYWENGVMVARRCTKCGEDKKIEEFSFENKNKGTRHSECKECNRKYKKKYNYLFDGDYCFCCCRNDEQTGEIIKSDFRYVGITLCVFYYGSFFESDGWNSW